ncbi:hypothetical protein AB4K20DRAFT_1978314 [Rhizopus microsporus]
MVIRDTQKNKCQCFIKLVASSSGGLMHSHPISSCRTIYAIHRKQSQEVIDLVMRTLSLPTPNPVETVMQVLCLNSIDNVLKKDIYNIKDVFFKSESSKEMYAFISSLQEKNYLVQFTVDSQNCICSVFFTHEEAIKEARMMPESVIVDATYKTNVHKLTFVNIVGASNVTSANSGRESLQLFPIACAWVSNELETTYTWVFEQYSDYSNGYDD